MADENDSNAKPGESGPAAPRGPASAPPPASPPKGQRTLSLLFRDLPAGVPASLNLLLSDAGAWSVGNLVERPVGLQLRAVGPSANVGLSSLLVTQKQIQVSTATAAPALELQLYVQTDAPTAGGTVLLPAGASVTIASSRDRTNVIGSGSWTLQLGPAVS